MSVAIFGAVDDPHPIHVRDLIRESDVSCEILDPDSTNFTFSISFEAHGLPMITFRLENGETFKATVFWWRTKPKLFRFEDSARQEAVDFAQREWAHSLRSVLTLTDATVLNRPDKQFFANHKPIQLSIAQQVGLKIPPTFITNDYQKIPPSPHGVIYKPLTWLSRFPGEMLFANMVTPELLSENRESIQSAPCIFQDFVDKIFEVRVSVFGDTMYGTKILSQKSKRTSVDWRRGIGDDIYDPIDVPPEIQNMIKEFLSKLELYSGRFCLVINRDGEWVFLECNPAGQWIWLEQMTGEPMTKSFVDLLLSFVQE